MSPYEGRLAHENFRRVGLVALVREGQAAALAAAAAAPPPPLAARLAAAKLTNVHLYTRAAGENSFLFAFLEYEGSTVEAVPSLLRDDPWFAALTPLLQAHPRATKAGAPWLRMELINVIGPTLPAPLATESVAHLGFLAGLKPASELTYRTLHQTNWPGVIDQMARSHYRHWVTFQLEWGEELLLFTYCEYVGSDKPGDDAALASDPVTQRWWKHTEPCLIPVEPAAGLWAPMAHLLALPCPAIPDPEG